jgi:hypothetical protein
MNDPEAKAVFPEEFAAFVGAILEGGDEKMSERMARVVAELPERPDDLDPDCPPDGGAD